MGLLDGAISAFIAFKHNERQIEQQTTERLNQLCPDDKQITLEFVTVSIFSSSYNSIYSQKMYKNIAQVKQSLKRTVVDDKPKVPAKKIEN